METSKLSSHPDNTEIEITGICGKPQPINRREFMKLSLEERQRILAEQAQQMLIHYQKDKEWKELEIGDLVDY